MARRRPPRHFDFGSGVTARRFHARGERRSYSGLILEFPDGCRGAVFFDTPAIRRCCPERARWTVESWRPLTLSPSIACSVHPVEHHGFIRAGRWVQA